MCVFIEVEIFCLFLVLFEYISLSVTCNKEGKKKLGGSLWGRTHDLAW